MLRLQLRIFGSGVLATGAEVLPPDYRGKALGSRFAGAACRWYPPTGNVARSSWSWGGHRARIQPAMGLG